MKCFSIDEREARPGLPITREPYPHVGVGEEGRGRRYTRFPVGRQFAESLSEEARIERASVIETRKGGLLLVEEKNSADRRAIVLVDVAAGFRGSTEWTSASAKEEPCPRRGGTVKYWEDRYTCSLCGAPLAEDEVKRNGDSLHPDEGTYLAYEAFPPRGITILAEGKRAQGEAGRMGGHVVRLLLLEPGTAFRVLRRGRLYGEPAEVIISWSGEDLRVCAPDEISPQEGEEGESL